MERGLIWLPLLLIFFWLAWSGWNEYQKVEAYRHWAEAFDKAKYDILAVLGQKQTEITWGKPTRQGPTNLQTFSLEAVQSIGLMINDQSVELDSLPEKGRKIELEFQFKDSKTPIRVPFTEIPLAAQWGQYLRKQLDSN